MAIGIQSAYARCGSVDYGIMVVISALQIYIKMNYHEGDITKSVMILFGGILFMIGASVVMPALFGYQDMNFIF